MSIETDIQVIPPVEGQDTTPALEVLTVVTALDHHEVNKVIEGVETPEGLARRCASDVEAKLVELLSNIPDSVRERVEATFQARAEAKRAEDEGAEVPSVEA